LATIVAVLVVSVVVASWIPARRAASVHPSEALRG
jgi:ABC-type lipoprotein release transport system permease subunit